MTERPAMRSPRAVPPISTPKPQRQRQENRENAIDRYFGHRAMDDFDFSDMDDPE